ncbi:MAG: TIR domain-containing protein [Rhodanobacteraceae bacterium]
MPEPTRTFTYRAFISYSHRDKAWAGRLHKALETYRVPSRLVGQQTETGVIPGRLHPVFRDREELASATDLNQRVEQALRESANLIVICSRTSAASHWVNEEVLAFKRMGRGESIFCMIVDGEPGISDWPGHEGEECFCPALRHTIDEHGQITHERTEPVAADARPGKDGKANATLKLIAGMLGVGLDQLKQREQHRQIRRMAAITALALVVMAITSVLAVYALISSHAAVAAQQAAQRRQKQAEGLVDFMLGNLSDKLQAESRLDVMQDVDNKAMAYFASLPPTDVNDTALAQRAKALEKIGVVRLGVGHLSGAMEAFRASTAISSNLASREPKNIARQVAYSRTLAYIGMTHWDQGKLGAAQLAFEQARQVLKPLLGQAPSDMPLLQQLTYLDSDLDHVLAALGHPEKAVELTRERLELDRKLVKAKPNDVGYASDLGQTHNELGRLALHRGDLATAIAEYRADDAIETRLSAGHPLNHSQQENMLETHAILGRTLALAGDSTSGIGDLQYSVKLADQLSQFDPQDSEAREDIGMYSTQQARLQRASGDLRAAATLNGRALTLLVALLKKDPTNEGWQRDYASALTEQAAESVATGDTDASKAQAQAALRILEPMLNKHPDERRTLLATTNAKLLLASVTADPQAVHSLREQALRTMQAVKFDRADPRLLALQAKAMLALNQASDAQPVIKQLWNEGYRDAGFVDLLQRERMAYPANPAFQARLLATARIDESAVAPQAGGKRHP